MYSEYYEERYMVEKKIEVFILMFIFSCISILPLVAYVNPRIRTTSHQTYSVSCIKYNGHATITYDINGENLHSVKLDTMNEQGIPPGHPPDFPDLRIFDQIVSIILFGGLTVLVILVIIWEIRNRKRRMRLRHHTE
jgi:hypothetical protein